MKPMIRHGLVGCITLISVAVLRLHPVAAGILFRADFETGDFRQFGPLSKKLRPGDIAIESEFVRSGKHAGRFTIHEDDVFNAGQLRAQAYGPEVKVEEGTDTFASFWIAMKEPPKGRDNFFYWEGSPPPRYNNVMTWWVEPKAEGPGTLVRYGTGNLGRNGVLWEADFSVGVWHQLGMHIFWSEDPDKGHVRLWWDGTPVLDRKVKTKGPQSVYFSQPGIHRSPHAKSVDTIYFDDIICATTLDEIAIRKPESVKSE